MNLNSVNQLLMRALLGMQFVPHHFNAPTPVIHAPVHTVGTGLNDITSQGTSTALVDHVYSIKINATGTPDHFEVSVDGGAYGAPIAITGSAQSIGNGVTVTFAATTGHTLNDVWTVTVPAGVSIPTAKALGNIAPNSVGNGAKLAIYDGNSSSGTLLYEAGTADWTAGQLVNLGYALQNAEGLYVVLTVSTTNPDLIVGTN